MTSCDQCGFVYEELPTIEVPDRLRAVSPAFRERLAGVPTVRATRRPAPGVWSPHEYACHVRDVLLVQRERLVSARAEARPIFSVMHRDERVDLARYDAHPTAQVLDQLAVAAELCASAFDGLDDATWRRPVVYNWPAPAERDIAWLGRNAVHEGVHHLHDVDVLLSPTKRPPA